MFTLNGTARQNQLVQRAIDLCDFPWHRLAPGLKAKTGRDAIPVGWGDLSRYVAPAGADVAEHHNHAEEFHALEYRKRVLGLFWYAGRISLDTSLETNPALAAEIFISEVAHAIDVFYLTPEQRHAIWNLYHEHDTPGHDHDVAHGWFDTPFVSWTGEPW